MRATVTIIGAALLALTAVAGTAAASSRAVPRCGTADLTVSLKQAGAAAGTAYYRIVFRNHTGHACSLTGYPGVSYVAGTAGRQVGPAASRDPGHIRTVVIPSGRTAHALLREADTLNYSKSTCQPRHVRGLRVYPPNTRAAVFLPWSHRVCSKRVGQTGVRPVRRGG
jgi:hypothetical protein